MSELDLAAIRKRSIVGILALTSRTFFLQVISFLAMFALTVFLSPEVFGVFFVVTAAVNFLNYFSDIGLAAALVQKKEKLDKKELGTTFIIQQSLVVSLVLISLLFSSRFARLYGLDLAALNLLRALIVSFFLSSLKTIPSVLLERKLDFKSLISPQIGETLVFNFLAVFLAWKGFGTSSFIWAVLARGVTGLVLMYLVSPWWPEFNFDKKSAKRLLSFGIPFQANSLLALLKDDLLTVFLGKLLPLSQIGFIGWAQKWANLPLRFIMDNVIKVSFPTYSRIQDNLSVLRQGIEKALFTICFITFPILMGLMVLSQSLVESLPHYLKWYPALTSLYLFSFQALFSCVSTTLTNVLNATGRIKTTLKLMTFWTVLTWILTLVLIKLLGFNGVSIASLVVATSVIIPIILVKRIVDFSFKKSVVGPLIGSLFMAFFLKLVVQTLVPDLFLLVLLVPAGAIIYLLIMFILAREKIREVLISTREVFKRE